MYRNIVSGDLKLPVYLSKEACSLITSLLSRNPHKRLGAGKNDSEQIKKHPWFSSIDWQLAKERGLNMPKPEILEIEEDHISPNIFGEAPFY